MEPEMNETQAIVDQYIHYNRTDNAFKLLCKTAIGLAKNQRFNEAETCRDRLYENEKSVQRLLGRTIWVRFYLKANGYTKPLIVTGTVRSVKNHPLNNYLIHLKLNPGFSDPAIKTISKIAL